MSRLVLLSLFFFCCAHQVRAQVNLTNGLVAYYPFNNSAADATGNGHTGQLVNGVQFTADRFGNANSACLFDSIDDYVKVFDNGAFSTPNFSLVVWFQTQTDNLQNLVGKRDFTTTGGTAGAKLFFKQPILPDAGTAFVKAYCSPVMYMFIG